MARFLLVQGVMLRVSVLEAISVQCHLHNSLSRKKITQSFDDPILNSVKYLSFLHQRIFTPLLRRRPILTRRAMYLVCSHQNIYPNEINPKMIQTEVAKRIHQRTKSNTKNSKITQIYWYSSILPLTATNEKYRRIILKAKMILLILQENLSEETYSRKRKINEVAEQTTGVNAGHSIT